MELKLTNEENEKVFAMYWGQPYLVCYNLEGNAVIDPISGNAIGEIEPDIENKRDLLLLTPLSSITDEDAIEVANKIAGIEGSVHYSLQQRGRELVNDLYKRYNNITHFIVIEIHQYLISKCYDVPLFFGIGHPCNGMTAIQLGIAIDKNTLS